MLGKWLVLIMYTGFLLSRITQHLVKAKDKASVVGVLLGASFDVYVGYWLYSTINLF